MIHLFGYNMKRIIALLVVLLPVLMCSSFADEPKQHSIGKSELYWLLNRAASYGDDIGTKILLKAGADPNGLEDYKEFKKHFGIEASWPINQASWKGHTDIVQILLDAGAKVDFPEGEGYTALIIATMNNHLDTVKVLIKAGADSNYRLNGHTALEIAQKKDFTDIATFLQEHTLPKAEQD